MSDTMPSALTEALDRLAAKVIDDYGEDFVLAIVHQAMEARDQAGSTLPPKALEPVIIPPDTASHDQKAMERVIKESPKCPT